MRRRVVCRLAECSLVQPVGGRRGPPYPVRCLVSAGPALPRGPLAALLIDVPPPAGRSLGTTGSGRSALPDSETAVGPQGARQGGVGVLRSQSAARPARIKRGVLAVAARWPAGFRHSSAQPGRALGRAGGCRKSCWLCRSGPARPCPRLMRPHASRGGQVALKADPPTLCCSLPSLRPLATATVWLAELSQVAWKEREGVSPAAFASTPPPPPPTRHPRFRPSGWLSSRGRRG